jgi:hypothetical protein
VFPSAPRASNRRCWPRLSQPRAPLQGTITEGSTPVPEDRLHPPWLPSPTAHEESRIRSTRACLTRHRPSSAFLTLSTVCAPLLRPGFFHPGNAPGVPPSGPCSSPGGRTSLEVACSPAVRTLLVSPLSERMDPRLQSFPLPGESVSASGRNPSRGRCPPGVFPSKALPVSVVGSDPPRPLALSDAAMEPRDPSSLALSAASRVAPLNRPVLRSFPLPETLAFPPCGGAGPSGVRHLVSS